MAPTLQINVTNRQPPPALHQVQYRTWTWLALLTLLNGWGSLPVIAAESNVTESQGTNIVLLMDSSGSMKTTDPENLRKPAAKLLVSLLGKNDRASIISFSDHGYPVTYLLDTASQKGQEQLFSAIEKISSRGLQTNLYSAIATAEGVLAQDNDPTRRRLIVLMSDGKMDLGDDEISRAHSEKLFSELLPQLKATNTELQTIAFTEQSDKVLLAKIARETGGNFYVAESDKELHSTFSKIFEQTARPNMLPVEGGHFLTDNSINEITIVGSKDNAEVSLALTAPNGNTYFPHNKPDNYKWLTTPLFDMITISKPDSGEWELQASSNKNKAYIITNLELQISIHPPKPGAGERIQIQAWLEKEGEVLNSAAILNNLLMSAQVTLPSGRFAQLPIKSEQTPAGSGKTTGIYTGNLVLPDAGRYEISLTADSGTFQRKRGISFSAESLPTETGNANPQVQSKPTTKEIRATENTDQLDPTLLLAIYIFIGTNIVLVLTVLGSILWRKRKKNVERRTAKESI